MDFFSKQKLSAWIIVLLVVLNLATLATLWYQNLNRPSPPGQRLKTGPQDIQRFLVKELNLSSRQAGQFEQKRREHFEDTRFIQDSIFRMKGEMMDLLLSERFDPEQVENIAAGIGTLQADLEKLLSHHLHDLMSVCTADQREIFKSLIRDLLEMMRPGGAPVPPRRGKRGPEKDGKGPLHRRYEKK